MYSRSRDSKNRCHSSFQTAVQKNEAKSVQLENESGVILCFITEHTTTRHVLTVFEHGVCHAMFYLFNKTLI